MESRSISPGQVTEALLQQQPSGKRLGALLVELGAIDERKLVEALAAQLDLPVVDLRQESPDPLAVAMVPEAVARRNNAMPVRVDEDALSVALADPLDVDAVDAVLDAAAEPLAAAGLHQVRLLIAPLSDLRRAMDGSYRTLSNVKSYVDEFEALEAAHVDVDLTRTTLDENAPVVQVVNIIVAQALRDRASDVHLEPQDDRLRVRFRIDGALHDVLALPSSIGPALVSRIKIMANMNIVERRRPQDGQFQTEIEGRPLDVRVSTIDTNRGEKAVLRLLDKSRPLYRMSELGMPANTHTQFSRLVRSPFGMVICAGPTGMGKTTTLYATLTEINQSQYNVMTIEDPVEYQFPSVNQIQINEQAGVTFASGLKAILRQDPDIILVGEIRDVETARIAVQSALTGHLVLSSLHATDAALALQRLLDMGIESFLIASSVLAVVGQRLVRRTCTFCKVPYRPSRDELAFYEQSGGPRKFRFLHGEGCNFCARTGYQERIGIYELLRVTDEIKQLVMANALHEELREMAVKQGMTPLRDEAIRLVAEDTTTISEIVRATYTVQ